MTTANDMKTRAQLDAEIADLQEALSIAVLALKDALKIGAPQVRNRQSLIAWSHLEVTASALMAETHKH
jgi:LPS O-antigen subunit length determinant protein (WzzB/FepE family)